MAPVSGSAREDVLGRVRRALADRPGPVQVPRAYRTAGEKDWAALLDLLTERLVDYKAIVRRCAAAELPAVLVESVGRRRVVVPPGLPWELPGAVVDGGLAAAELDRLDGVVTACAVAIAETGTIVLDAGPGQGPRRATLVPDLHVCVVPAAVVVGSVPEALDALAPAVREHRSALTWIAGPSATSDIELERVEGVHGPRRLEVLVVAGG